MFILSEIDGHNEDRELARAVTPALLLGDFDTVPVRQWRVTLDEVDIATVDTGPIRWTEEQYTIFGTNPYNAEETMHVAGLDNMVQVVREHLQRFYDLGLYARDDFPGIRVIPGLTFTESVV
jgi:hypothetical protein